VKIKPRIHKLFATIISTFIEKHKIENLDVVCSHGHTFCINQKRIDASNWPLTQNFKIDSSNRKKNYVLILSLENKQEKQLGLK
jgi:hypothetical protein